jgi:hypothetical protein
MHSVASHVAKLVAFGDGASQKPLSIAGLIQRAGQEPFKGPDRLQQQQQEQFLSRLKRQVPSPDFFYDSEAYSQRS